MNCVIQHDVIVGGGKEPMMLKVLGTPIAERREERKRAQRTAPVIPPPAAAKEVEVAGFMQKSFSNRKLHEADPDETWQRHPPHTGPGGDENRGQDQQVVPAECGHRAEV